MTLRAPGYKSPLGGIVMGPANQSQLGVLSAIAHVGTPSTILSWEPYRKGRGKPFGTCRSRGWFSGFCAWTLILLGCPRQVWAAPPGLAEAVYESERFADSLPSQLPPADNQATTEAPDIHESRDRPGSSSPTRNLQFGDRVEGVIDEATGDFPQGVPAPHVIPGLPSAEASAFCEFDAFVVAPGYHPELLTFPLQFPCEPSDAEAAVARHLQLLRLQFADVVVAAKPQPWPDASVFLVRPAWATFAGLTTVVIDATKMPVAGNGPIFSCFLTRPTNRVEILREAGFYGLPQCNIFVGLHPDPLAEHEIVYLETWMPHHIDQGESEARLPTGYQATSCSN